MTKTEAKYGIIRKKTRFLPIELLRVPHQDMDLTVSFPAFGPGTYRENINSMGKDYSHPKTGERISFREPTTAESISAAAYNFEKLAKPMILDPERLQLGYIVRTSEGVFVNPPRDAQRNQIIDEQILKSLLDGGIVNGAFFDKSKKINDIYLSDNDFGFAPYETFKTVKAMEQDAEEFAQSGLARLLEHTNKPTAKRLVKIASKKFYNKGILVFGFSSSKEPILSVACLYSGKIIGDDGLCVTDEFGVSTGNSYAFGVLEKPANLARKIGFNK